MSISLSETVSAIFSFKTLVMRDAIYSLNLVTKRQKTRFRIVSERTTLEPKLNFR